MSEAKRNSPPVTGSTHLGAQMKFDSIVEETLSRQKSIWPEIAVRAQAAASSLPKGKPGRIVLLGIGSSFFAAKLASFPLIRELAQAGHPYAGCEVVACSSMAVGHELFPRATDWVFAFTHRGGTVATLHAIAEFDRAGAFTMAVTGAGAPKPAHASAHLPTSPMERCEPHTVSVTGAICAVTTLLLGDKAREEWFALSREADPKLADLAARAGQGPTIGIGEWEAEWLARETALKLMEMGRLGVRAFGTEEYFHGPKLARQAGDRFWFVGHATDLRAQDVRLQLKPAHAVAVDARLFGWVSALVELQWLSLAVARNLGVQPDGLG
jgi:fructoselysine-6-P-deglycase FrlB-like protein